MHVLFLAPESQVYYREFVRGLKEVGARVTGLGHLPRERLPAPLMREVKSKLKQLAEL